jgi:predicted phage terminase large subunit-like protein
VTRPIRPLLDFVPALSPRFVRPSHLAPIAALCERVLHEPVHACLGAPPRMGKSELFEHAVAWWLRQAPHLRIGWLSYSGRIAERKSRGAMQRAERAGVPISREQRSAANWRTGVEDGGLWATSPDGSTAGEGFDILIFDDPIANRAAAESSAEREALWDFFNDVAFTRLEPEGSIFVSHHRWHTDDLIGRLVARNAWPYVSLPAINEQGESLWPARWSVARLRQIEEQLGAYGWSSLYQQQPRPRTGSLFNDVRFYSTLPEGIRYGIGADFAYSTKTHADYSVAVVLAELDGVYYVVDVVRGQVRAPEFRVQLDLLAERYKTTPCAFVSGTERGVTDMMGELGTAIDARPAVADKFVRAQPVAAAWNAGKVLLPRAAPWLDAFVTELLDFTGVKDRHDDQVDATAAAHASVFHAPSIPKPPPAPVTAPSLLDGLGGGSTYDDMLPDAYAHLR